jgi:pimeloyl-ACP methyl ester carboxylesterase
MRWAPKGPLNFRALIENQTPPSAYRALKLPVLIIRGEHAPKPTRLVADRLLELLPDAHLIVVDGAGHMGAFTHASEVSRLIYEHIVGVTGDGLPESPWSRSKTLPVLAHASEVAS